MHFSHGIIYETKSIYWITIISGSICTTVLSGMKVAWASKESGGSAGHPCRSSRAEADTGQYEQHCRRSPPCGLLLQSHCAAPQQIHVFSHYQTLVVCSGCKTMLFQPTGGKGRLTKGCLIMEKMKPFLRLFTTTYPRCGETNQKRSQDSGASKLQFVHNDLTFSIYALEFQKVNNTQCIAFHDLPWSVLMDDLLTHFNSVPSD
uniref:Uncharacterized protein n=1 Tax=Aegilops tauschii subsp. strangulata TaxID=200361 RepID=A0A453BHU8_AEGTS